MKSSNVWLRRLGRPRVACFGSRWEILGTIIGGAAYRKAMGLNLKERSSGKHQGRLKITKRGPSVVRRWMYFAAMRLTQDPHVKPWH